MAEKCALCGEKLTYTFLQKPLGTYMRNASGKRRVVCSACQQQHTPTELKEKI